MDSLAFGIEENSAAHTATIRFGRPAEGNRLLTHEIRELGRSIRELGSKDGVKVVILRADGDAFCLGRQPDAGAKAPTTAIEVRERVTQPILDLYADVRATPVPVIAVVQGEARGFGCALVGQCDLAIAVDNAMFSMPEMDTHLPPTLAISAVLGKVTPKRLLHMVYTRDRIDAAEALALGLLSEVVPAADLDAAVERMVGRLSDRNRASLCAIKEYMSVAPYVDPVAASRLAANILSVVLSSPKEV